MNTKHSPRIALLLAGLALSGSLAAADPWQPLADLRAAAEKAAAATVSSDGKAAEDSGETLAVAADSLDPRLRLRRCAEPLATTVKSAANGGRTGGRVSVEVRCPPGAGQPEWRIYVPVQISVGRPVVVAARSLARDAILAPGDVVLAHRDLGSLPYGYFPALDQAVGQRLKRAVMPGDVVAPNQVAAPVVVRRGQSVTLQVKGSGVQVQMPGIARDEGAAGDRIAVENASSGRTVQGTVLTAGVVEIRLP